MTIIMCARWMWACCRSSRAAGSGDAGRVHLFRQPVLQDTDSGWCLISPTPSRPRSRSARRARCSPACWRAGDWLSNSFLDEAGVKFTALDDHLLGSLDWYRQNRTQLSQGAQGITSVMGTVARGRGAGAALCGERQSQPDPRGQHCSTPPSKDPTTALPISRRALTGFRRRTALAEPMWSMIFRPCRERAAITKTRCCRMPSSVPISPGPATADLGPLGRELRRHLCRQDAADRAQPHHLSVIYGDRCQRLCAMGCVGSRSQCEQSG